MASLFSFTLSKPISFIKCSSASFPLTTQCPPHLLEEKYGRKGIHFTESGTVEMTVRNGSSLSLKIAEGLVTSYKPKVYWKEEDKGFEEILYTVPADASNPTKGGVGLALNEVSELGSGGMPCCNSEWVVKDVDSDALDALQESQKLWCIGSIVGPCRSGHRSIRPSLAKPSKTLKLRIQGRNLKQVELSNKNGNGTLEITFVISLYAVSMATAVIVKNNGSEPIKLSSAILSHLKIKSRGGSAIEGLKGCSYCTHPPLSSSFGILSPVDAMKPEPPSWLASIFSSSGGDQEANKSKTGLWTVEDNRFTIMRHKLSRVYTVPPEERLKRIYRTAPSKYETIDQGTKLCFRVIRMGFEDIYLASPGSFSQRYGKDYFICTGPASMLVPVVVNPGEEWRGALVIEHDNL